MTSKREWQRRARYWRKAYRGQRRVAKSWIDHGDKCERETQECQAKLRQAREREAAALNTAEEYRQQVREMDEQLPALLAWQRGVLEALPRR